MTVARVRMDELANAWVGDADTPFQLGLLGVFDAGPWQRPDGTFAADDLGSALAARAGKVPQLRRRILWTRRSEGPPAWFEDAAFDASSHVGCATLPPGEDLPTWAANQCLRPLDLGQPLWRIDVVGGLPEGRFAVLVVVHHILADGILGARIAGSLFDASADTVVVPSPAERPPPLPSHRDLVRDRAAQLRARRRHASAGTASTPLRGRHRFAGLRDALEGFRTPLATTSLPQSVGARRRMVVSTVQLEVVQRIGNELGGTVNDVVLAAVTDGLRDLLLGRGEALEGVFLRTTVPVAAGGEGQAMGMLLVDLPVGEADPLSRWELIRAATTAGKARLRAHGSDVTDLLHLPLPLARALVRWGRRWGSSRVNLSVSNVRGPSGPLWLAGASLLEALPIAPLVSLVPMSVAALSYAGSLGVTVNADASIADLAVVAAGMDRSFERYAALSELRRRASPGSRAGGGCPG
ncbi:MAG TPA: wax ester/triacylglycerol synthase domain-containing protein [Humibacillus xanthopallidus]|nr:wax ester/triacylglycerol synthase domain-containing protein [Humibacillus xanthopallidus]